MTTDEYLPTGGYIEFTGFPASDVKPELLPEGEAVCRVFNLGEGRSGLCSARAVLSASQQQTDPKLWFTSTAAGPGNQSTCAGGRAFDRIKTTEGKDVVESLCPAPDEDDKITATELAAFEALAWRLNNISHPKFAEFRQALDLKHIIETSSAPDREPAR